MADTESLAELKDWRGTPITVGATVTYPCRRYSSLWMNEAVVLAVGTKTEYGRTFPALQVRFTGSSSPYRANRVRMVTLTAIDNVTVVAPCD